MIKKILISLMVLGLLVLGAGRIFAEGLFSQNFEIRESVVDNFGGWATTSNFQLLSAGGQAITGESTSTSFILRSGFLYFEERFFTPQSENWQWFDDEENLTPQIALAPENTSPINISDQNIIKLRLTVKEIGGIAGRNVKFQLQFSTSSAFSAVQGVTEQEFCALESLWCYADAAGNDNQEIIQRVLSDSNEFGTHNESGALLAGFRHPAISAAEYEFTIKPSGVPANAVYFFRVFDLVNNKPLEPAEDKTFPGIIIKGAQLTFTISGIEAGAEVEGAVTKVGTTPEDINFGNLTPSEDVIAAQRLIVTTNPVHGYQIFVFQRQNFLSDEGGEIPPVQGDNASPSGWLAACPDAVSGCYGYHVGDDTLSSVSTRFAEDDTYAGLESAAREIAFSSGPATNEANDIVFRVKITSEQPVGIYQSVINYIIVPSF